MVGLHILRSEPCSQLYYHGYSLPSKHLDFLDHDEAPTCGAGDCAVLNVFNTSDIHRDDSMIHIAVPDTQILVEKHDGLTKYTAFNVHINGWFHSAVRFSHLHQLSEHIKQRWGSILRGPEFPPKRLFSLDERQLEVRREQIAKYFTALIQHPEVVRHSSVEKRFLDLQVNSFRATSTHVTVDVFLGDGEKIVVRSNVANSTNEVMKMLSEQLGADSDVFLWHFGLFMAKSNNEGTSKEGGFDVQCVRLLRNFESPYISLQVANQKSAAHGLYHKLVLRKLIWDPRIEESLFDNAPITSLLYRQATSDLANGSFEATRSEILEKLRAHERNNDQTQFLRTCHLQPTYSFERLGECLCDYPKPSTRCRIKIGRRTIVISYGDRFEQERKFLATKIRVWKISKPLEAGGPLVFQFEYVVPQENFEWVTLYTDQAIIMSLLIQSFANEILHEHRNMTIEQQLFSNGGGSGMSIFLEPRKAAPVTKPRLSNQISQISQQSDEGKNTNAVIETTPPPPVRKHSGQSVTSRTSLKSARSAICSPAEVVASGAADPLGVGNYQSFNDVFTTITDVLPMHNEAFSNITDDDL